MVARQPSLASRMDVMGIESSIDPESSRYSAIENLYFYESFKNLVDALRHFDKIIKLMKAGKNQPVQLDDRDDEIPML